MVPGRISGIYYSELNIEKNLVSPPPTETSINKQSTGGIKNIYKKIKQLSVIFISFFLLR